MATNNEPPDHSARRHPPAFPRNAERSQPSPYLGYRSLRGIPTSFIGTRSFARNVHGRNNDSGQPWRPASFYAFYWWNVHAHRCVGTSRHNDAFAWRGRSLRLADVFWHINKSLLCCSMIGTRPLTLRL